MMADQFSAEQKMRAAWREVKQREKVYSRLVASGSMKQSEADYQIGIMKAIATDYERMAEKERLI
jgi:hypothetical protein